MKKTSPRHLLALGLLVLVAFVVRAYHPVTRPVHWLIRAQAFTDALQHGDWAETYQQYHPGVTTMAIGGAGVVAYYRSAAIPPVRALLDSAMAPYLTTLGRDNAAGAIALGAALAVLTGLIAWGMAALGGWRLGLAAGGLLAFSPVFLSQSRVFHVDALLAAFMLLSAVLILLYRQSRSVWHLLFSGLAGGLALLTKTPALYLLPYTALVLGADVLLRLRTGWAAHEDGRAGWIAREAWRGLVGPGLVWLLFAALPFVLWPAMWVKPLQVLDEMYVSIARHTAETHPNRRFFLGRIYQPSEPPNRWFYLVVLAVNASFVTFALSLLALGWAVLRRRWRLPVSPATFWLLAAYVGFFTLQMTIGSKQDQRYLVPAQAGLVMLAAVGLAAAADLVERAVADRRWVAGAVVAAGVAAQMVAVMPYAPNYGVAHNHLLGGNRTAVHWLELGDQREGVMEAGAYLAQHAESGQTLGIVTSDTSSLLQLYSGEMIAMHKQDTDYYLFQLIDRQRNMALWQWRDRWAEMQDREPQLTVAFDGVAFVHLYAADPSTLPPPQVVNRGGLWLVAFAWGWTLALAGLIVWSARRTPEETRVF